LTIAAVPDFTRTLNIGTLVDPFGAIAVTGELAFASGAGLTAFAGGNVTLSANIKTISGDVNLTAGAAILQSAGTLDIAGSLTVTADSANFASAGNKATNFLITSGTNARVDGSFDAAGQVLVEGTLGGTGSVGAVTVAGTGTIAPGASPGKLSTGSIAFTAGSAFNVELDGVNPGTEHDQLAVTGTVDLGGAALAATVGFAPTIGQVFRIIDNDGSDDVIGTFAGLTEGATVMLGGFAFSVSYEGGDGNDLTLTRQANPPTASVTFGDGTDQRSMVKQVVVTFSEAVNFSGNVVDAFTLSRTGTGAPTGNVALIANPSTGPASSVTITFSGSFTENGSLIDGFYNFSIDADQVTGIGGKLNGGTDFSVTGDSANKFFRLFGDADGNGATNLLDFAVFREAFNVGPSSVFDFDNTGGVDLLDFARFRENFNLSP
jgi:hypothetical protein